MTVDTLASRTYRNGWQADVPAMPAVGAAMNAVVSVLSALLTALQVEEYVFLITPMEIGALSLVLTIPGAVITHDRLALAAVARTIVDVTAATSKNRPENVAAMLA